MKHQKSSRARRGGTLVLALIVVLVVGMMAGSFMQLNSAATRRQALAVDNKLSFYVAEAGLTESYVALLAGKTGDVGSTLEPAMYGDGLVWAEAQELPDGFVQVASTGLAGRGRTELRVIFQRSSESAAQLGVFSNQSLVLPAGTTLDGYDSSEEPGEGANYAWGQTGFGDGNGDAGDSGDWLFGDGDGGGLLELAAEGSGPVLANVRSNGDIIVHSSPGSPTTLVANLEYGTAGQVQLLGGPTHEGETYSATQSVTLPQPVVPALTQTGNATLTAGGTHVVDAGSYGYQDVLVGLDTTLKLVGPLVLLVDSLTLQDGASIVIDERLGPVQVFAEESVTFEAGSSFEQIAKDSTKFEIQIVGSGESTIASTGEMHGFLYAPSGRLRIGSGAEIFGSLVADSLTLDPGVSLHFDEHLAELCSTSLLPRLVSWRIEEMTDLSDAGVSDPYAALGVTPADCVPLADATDMHTLTLTFRNWSGAAETYDGPWNEFQGWRRIRQLGTVARDGTPLTARQRDRFLSYVRELQESARDSAQDLLDTYTGA